MCKKILIIILGFNSFVNYFYNFVFVVNTSVFLRVLFIIWYADFYVVYI